MKLLWIAAVMMLVAGSHAALNWPYGTAIQPSPSINTTSGILCGFVGSSAQTIVTTLYNYSTGAAIGTWSNASMPPNNTYLLAYYNFSNLSAGDRVGVECSTGANTDHSQMYTVSSGLSFGDTSNDNLAIGSMLGFAIFAAIFAYLHLHAQARVWSLLWRELCLFMILMVLLSILYFSQVQNAPAISNIALALVIGFSGVFVISLWLFILETIKDVFTAVKNAYDGRKDEHDKGI